MRTAFSVVAACSVLVCFGTSVTKAESINFNGQTLEASRLYNSTMALPTPFGAPVAISVGAGAEDISGLTDSSIFGVDVSATNVLIDFKTGISWDAAGFNGFGLSDASNAVADISAVTINGSTTVSGLDMSRVTFDANNIYVNWRELNVADGQVISLDVSFASATTVAPLPGAAMGGILLLGLTGGKGLLSRRRKPRDAFRSLLVTMPGTTLFELQTY